MDLDVKPAFKTVPNHEPFERTLVTYNPLNEGEKKRKGPAFSYSTEMVESGGWRVFFPQGHSILITDRAELVRLGFDRNPPKIAMQLGEVVPENNSLDDDPEEIVRRNTKSRGRLTGGVDAALAG